MNIETSDPPPAEQAAFVPRQQEHSTAEINPVGTFFVRLVVVAAGIFVGLVLAMYLALSLGWVGC